MTKTDKKAKELIKTGTPTPFYIYDTDVVGKKIKNLQNIFRQKTTILYSMKSNPHKDLLVFLSKNKKVWIDVCSIGEAQRAMKAGFSPSRMSFVGPAKSTEELTYCIKNKIELVVVESEQELQVLNKLSLKLNKKVNIMMRVAMKQTMSLNGKIRDNHDTHFGISEDQLGSVLSLFNKEKKLNHIFLTGIHCYVQSNYLDPRFICFNFQSAIHIFKTLSQQFSEPLDKINLGGGFGIDYYQAQNSLDLPNFKKMWADLFKSEFTDLKKVPQLFVESGRYIMADAGTFYSKVLYTKENFGKNYVILDGGFTQNMSSTGYGQLIKRTPPLRIVSMKKKTPSMETKLYAVVGPSCYSADVLAHDFPMTDVKAGDLIAVDKSGAYGASFSPQDFLLRPHALEFVI